MTIDETLTRFDSLWDYDRPEETEQKFRELLAPARQSDDRAYLAELLTQIARAQALQRRFDEAHRTLDEARALLVEDQPRPRVRYLLERGRTYNSAGRPEEADGLFRQAWELAREHGEDGLAVDAAHMIAIVERPDRALEWNLRALELAQRSDDPDANRWLGSLYNNIGWTYHDLERYDSALESFQRGLAWEREKGRLPEARIEAWAVARTLRSLGRYEEALAMQRDNLEQVTKTGEGGGFVEEELGECLLALGQADEASPHFARAYAALSALAWVAESQPDRLRRLKELAGV